MSGLLAAGRASGRSRPTEETYPRWSSDGKELYYMDLTFSLLAVPVTRAGGALQFGAAADARHQLDRSAACPFYDVSPDGKKILLDRVAATGQPIGDGGYELYGSVKEINEPRDRSWAICRKGWESA